MIRCETCQHFRPARPLSQLLARDIGTSEPALLSELNKIAQDERELADAEASLKVEVLRLDEPELAWWIRPEMSDHCALDEARGRYQFHELRNADGRCDQHQAIASRPCTSCRHRSDPAGPADDQVKFARYAQLAADAAALEKGESNDLLSKLTEQIAATKAYEAVQVYYTRRSLCAPRYLPMCKARSAPDTYVTCCVGNRHDRCELHDDGSKSGGMFDAFRGLLPTTGVTR